MYRTRINFKEIIDRKDELNEYSENFNPEFYAETKWIGESHKSNYPAKNKVFRFANAWVIENAIKYWLECYTTYTSVKWMDPERDGYGIKGKKGDPELITPAGITIEVKSGKYPVEEFYNKVNDIHTAIKVLFYDRDKKQIFLMDKTLNEQGYICIADYEIQLPFRRF